MSEEQLRVLRMIEEGKISAEDGAKLLGALNASGRDPAAPPTGPLPPNTPLPPLPPLSPMPPFPGEGPERERERERDRARRGRGRGSWGWSWGDDVFWGGRGRRDPRDTGPLTDTGPLGSTGTARWFRVRVTDTRT